MNPDNFRVEPADFTADFDDLRAIREAVFVVEQNIPRDLEFDDLEPRCFHFAARDEFHQVIGTARLSPERQIGRMAVATSWRGKGVGKALMLALIEKAQKLGWPEVTLNAQTQVQGFYEKLGFSKIGDVFLEANIPHQPMRLPIEPLKSPSRPMPKAREPSVEITELNGLEITLMAIVQLTNKARKKVCIYTPDLEPTVYGRSDFIEAIKQFAITSGGGNVLIIVQDTLSVRSQPHPLIELAQRLPSAFQLRTPIEADDLQYPSAYVVNDRDGYLFRQQSSQYSAVWSPHLAARNRQLSEEFDRVWQRSRSCTEFRALGL